AAARAIGAEVAAKAGVARRRPQRRADDRMARAGRVEPGMERGGACGLAPDDRSSGRGRESQGRERGRAKARDRLVDNRFYKSAPRRLVPAALSASGAPARASRHRAFLAPWVAPARVRFLVQW